MTLPYAELQLDIPRASTYGRKVVQGFKGCDGAQGRRTADHVAIHNPTPNRASVSAHEAA